MSFGQIAGMFIGAVVGFAIGGPMGAMIGAVALGAVGAYIDPLTPDVPSPGQPDLGDLDMNIAEIGLPIPDVLGTTKIATGNYLWFCNNRVEEVTEDVDMDHGEETVVKGYRYYLTFALGICLGPVDKLLCVYKNDEVIYSADLACPGSGGESTVQLYDTGSMTFYFGTDDHAANSVIAGLIASGELEIPYNFRWRRLCWAFFDDVFIGEYNRAPNWSFVLQKEPACSFDP